MYRSILLILAGFLSFKTYSGSITGVVKDIQSEILPYCNVVLYDTLDQNHFYAATTDSLGAFLIKDIDNGIYDLEFTYLGYKTTTIHNVNIKDNNLNIGDVLLPQDAEMLDEVVIKATAPIIERQPDKLILNVENSTKSSGMNTLELLRSVPGVTVSGNNQIMINGKKDVQVMINGRLEMMSGDQLANLLKSIQSSNIKKIEVISNPSAKYDASAKGGILNIILKTSLRTGVNGSVYSTYAQNETWGNQSGFNLNMNHKKFTLGMNYNFTYNNLRGKNFTQRNFDMDTIISQFTDEGKSKNIEHAQYANLNMAYNINEKHRIGLKSQMVLFKNPQQTDNWLTILEDIKNTQNLEYQHTDNDVKSKNLNPSFTANYHADLDSSNTAVDATFDYSKFNYYTYNILETKFLDTEKNEYGIPLNFSQTNPFLADLYVYNIGIRRSINKNHSIEAGHKFTWTSTNNDIRFYSIIGNENTLDTLRSNAFEYTENINAAYMTWNSQWNKNWSANVGLRMEQTNANQYSITLEERKLRHYVDFFPSVFAQKNWEDKHSFNTSYSRKIKRPNFKDLNPFQYYNSQYYIWMGNANLQPEYADIVEMSYTLQNKYSITLGYQHQKNSSTYLAFQDDATNITRYIASNFRHRHNAYITLMANTDIFDWWNISYSVQYTFFKYNAIASNNQALVQSSNKVNLSFDNTFVLPKSFKINVYAFYTSRFLDATDVMLPNSMVNFSISKSFFDKKLNVNLLVNDIFHKLNFSFDTKFANINSIITNTFNSRFVGLSVTYNFNKGKSFENTRIKSSNEEEKDRI